MKKSSIKLRALSFALWVVASALLFPALGEDNDDAADLSMAISLMLSDPLSADPINGIANEYDDHYGHVIVVEWIGKKGDSVERQVQDTAEVALRIARLVGTKGLTPPGEHLVIKMALKKPDGSFINTFSVRYRWEDVLKFGKVSDLAPKGTIEQIWFDYWRTMCQSAFNRNPGSACKRDPFCA